VLIRLPQQKREGDYAGQMVAQLNHDLNPDAASGKLDVNFHGRDPIADVLLQADPDKRGTNDAARQYYLGIAQNIISKRSEIGIFTNIDQALTAPE